MKRMTIPVSNEVARLACRVEEGACVGKPYSCPDVTPGCPEIKAALSALARYEDEEERGRLIRLPCPMNTKIYLIVTKRARSYSTKQFRFIKTSQLTWCNLETVLRNFGKTAFLNREEAEAAMERMNKEDEDGRSDS